MSRSADDREQECWVSGLRRRDRRAIEEFFERYYDRVSAFLKSGANGFPRMHSRNAEEAAADALYSVPRVLEYFSLSKKALVLLAESPELFSFLIGGSGLSASVDLGLNCPRQNQCS